MKYSSSWMETLGGIKYGEWYNKIVGEVHCWESGVSEFSDPHACFAPVSRVDNDLCFIREARRLIRETAS